jgi:enoyl-CoA hydratase/carnithine racemase
MGDTVLYEAADGVATLTLNRPQRLNAITPQLVADFGAALARALDDGDVRVVRLRGAGSAFCAGYDIGWGEGMAFTQRGLADVGGAVADRDAPFGDYGQGPATV